MREGVFRMSGNVEAVKEITKQLELNTFQENSDPLSTAQVLKVFIFDSCLFVLFCSCLFMFVLLYETIGIKHIPRR